MKKIILNISNLWLDANHITLFEIQELWLSCDCKTSHPEEADETDMHPTSPIAPAHKRARSVDTGIAAQQHGPPAKLSKSHSAENLAATPGPAPFPGSPDNPAEQVFLRHRTSLGFEVPEVPVKDLQRIRDVMLFNNRVDQKQDIAFVEVCCGTNSALREACKVARMPYIGIVKRMETADMFQKVKEFVEVQQQLGYRWVHVHASTPCSSGSPLNFSAQIESDADRSWKGIMDNVSKYLLLGNSRSFELP